MAATVFVFTTATTVRLLTTATTTVFLWLSSSCALKLFCKTDFLRRAC